MVLHGLTCDFLQASLFCSESSHVRKWSQTSSWNGMSWGLFLQHAPREEASLQNSLFVHDLCHKSLCTTVVVHEYKHNSLMHFLLIVQADAFAMQVEPVIFFEISPLQHQFCSIFLSTCHHHILIQSRRELVPWNLFMQLWTAVIFGMGTLEAFISVCCLNPFHVVVNSYVWNGHIGKLSSECVTFHVGIVCSVCIIQSIEFT